MKDSIPCFSPLNRRNFLKTSTVATTAAALHAFDFALSARAAGGEADEPAPGESRLLTLTLQTRDPNTSQAHTETIKVDSFKVAVIIVDPWNYHWCMTACERVSAMVPRWNRALECARKMGMPVIWAPSDVAATYAGYRQRERALTVRLVPVPKVREMPPAHFTAPVGSCMCGPGISCLVNYGEGAINPGLVLAGDDLIASSTEEVYALLRERGITHVIYMGLHTNMCLFGKPGALKFMVQAGLKCMLARDINDAFTSYNPSTGYTPDKGTAQIDDDLERAGVPTIHVMEEWRKAGVWNDQWVVETVRIVPWGKKTRPYLFENSTTATLTAPWLEGVQIRYTLDGSEPGPDSTLYEGPLKFTETTELRAAAYRNGALATQPTSAYFARLPAMPPKAEVTLDELQPLPDPYSASWQWLPKKNASYDGQPLRIRATRYTKGYGMKAPTYLRYDLKPEWTRFVALAGVDDNMLDHQLGLEIAGFPLVVFKVFLDGQLAAESPVTRISQAPWRFDVPIPPGSRQIVLVCDDAGARSPYNLGNWVEAGFVLART